MSDYCGTCYYNKAKKVGEKACPFNSLYWNFYDRNANKLARNPRIGMMYKVWERMATDDRVAILEQAERYLATINEL
jgi:deoxyribodipyrimidine photolyase-related protein